jgi:polyisoprenoid-binding protein YceI
MLPNIMKSLVTKLVIFLALAGAALAESETFNFKDPKHGNSAVFKLVAPKETIQGSANAISGSVSFDPQNPAATKGKIVVEAKSLAVPNPIMKMHLHGSTWLEVQKYPEIAFEVKELKNVKTEGDKTMADVSGTFTLKGVSKDLTVPVTLTYLKDKLSQRQPGLKGDLLVVRSTFTIQRSDFNVNAHQNEDKVSDKIELTLGLAGAAPQ